MSASGYLTDLENEVMAELRAKSRNLLYLRDPIAWTWDILGWRLWSKQQEILHSFAERTYTLVKSCNGVGKTQVAGLGVAWFASVHDPFETSIMVSAPVRAQIDQMMFRYLREAYHLADTRGLSLPGEILPRQPLWVVAEPGRKNDLVMPKRPADSNLLSAFQGVHNDHVAVVLDEAGGLQEDFFIGANAVTTNKDAHILGIGNPDRLHTAFHRRFKDATFDSWHRISIGFDDTPNATGELIYPDDPVMDEKVKSRLVQASWAEEMRKSALPAVVAAKVDGEFPDEDDTTFFSEDVKRKAFDTELEPSSMDFKRLGVDLAYRGEDQCVAYLNWGGQIRLVDTWNRTSGTEHMESARRVHKLAQKLEVDEVRVDAAGTGAGVYSNLLTEAEFQKRKYILIGVHGSNSSPDRNRWLNARAWHYDTFRRGMADGRFDLDIFDAELRKDMDMQTWAPTGRGQIQITSKVELKKAGKRSPDFLDAAIYSAIDFAELIDTPAAGLAKGDVVTMDPLELMREELYGLPI